MRPSLLVTFLLFSILISQVQGMRLNKGFIPHEDHKILGNKCFTRTSDTRADVETMNLKVGHISGETRKLMTKATSTSSTSKKDGNRPKASQNVLGFGVNKDESLSVDSTLGSEHRDTTAEKYPDIIDLTRMDYYPTNRKPRIHN